MSFWLPMVGLAIVAVWVVARPWLSAHLPRSLRRRSANVAAYRTRVKEIDADLAAGVVTAEAAEALRVEQGQRLLGSESGAPEAEPSTVAPRRRGVGLALALLPVLIAGLWYLQTGSWRTAQQVVAGNSASADAAAMVSRINAMVDRLKARLRAHPEDDKGWAMLGRSEAVLQHYPASVKAYAKANRLSTNSNPAWLVSEAQSIILAGGRVPQDRLAGLLTQALKIAPDDPRALWYSGLVAARNGDLVRARHLWQTLANQKGVPVKVRTAIEQQIRRLGGNENLASASTAKAGSQSAVTIRLEVRLAPALASQLPKHATLYVYAKAASGPPMPLAVQRISNPKLPLHVKLDDSMGVMPTAKLSDYSRWIVGARLSRHGSALPQAGDLQGQIILTRSQAKQNKAKVVLIDKQVS